MMAAFIILALIFIVWILPPSQYDHTIYLEDADLHVRTRYNWDDSTAIITFGRDKKDMDNNTILVKQRNGSTFDYYRLSFFIDNTHGDKKIREITLSSDLDMPKRLVVKDFSFYRNKSIYGPDIPDQYINNIKSDEDGQLDNCNYIINLDGRYFHTSINVTKGNLTDSLPLDFMISKMEEDEYWKPYSVIKREKFPTRYITLTKIYGQPRLDSVYNISYQQKEMWLDKGWFFLDTILSETNPNVAIRRTVWAKDDKFKHSRPENEIVMFYKETADSLHLPVDGYHYKVEYMYRYKADSKGKLMITNPDTIPY